MRLVQHSFISVTQELDDFIPRNPCVEVNICTFHRRGTKVLVETRDEVDVAPKQVMNQQHAKCRTCHGSVGICG